MDLLKRTKLTVALTAFALALAACGSDDPATTGTSSEAASESGMESESEDMGSESEMESEAAIELPAEGEPGSLSAMADQPAATAASTNPVLTTLTAAVTQAGLVDTLNGPGPFTIFAPIDDAFAAIPETDLAALLADNTALTDVLTYHVVSGEALRAADLAELDSVDVVNEGSVTLEMDGETLVVNGQAAVLMADIQVANGVVHLIDTVLSE